MNPPKTPPASERAIKAIAPLLTIACFVGAANIPDRQWACSCFFAVVPYLLTTYWAVFDNFDAAHNDQADQADQNDSNNGENNQK